LVLNLSGKPKRSLGTAQDTFVLDTAFALIEGHPPLPEAPAKERECVGHPAESGVKKRPIVLA